jgi:hypothetical protein
MWQMLKARLLLLVLLLLEQRELGHLLLRHCIRICVWLELLRRRWMAGRLQ